MEHELEFQVERRRSLAYAPAPIAYPYHLQVWHYPQLGMDVSMWDRSLAQTYELPYSHWQEQEPLPDPVPPRESAPPKAGFFRRFFS